MLAAPGSYSREIFLAFCIALMAEEAPCPPQYAGHKSLYEVLSRAGLPVTSGRDVSCVNFGAKLSLGGRMDANHDAAWDFVLHGPSMRVAAFEPNPHDCHSLQRAVKQGAFARHNIAVECDFVRRQLPHRKARRFV